MWSRHWTPAFRRYNARVLASALTYAGVLVGAVWLFKHRPPAGALRYLVAAAPAVPLAAMIVSVGLFLKEEADEVQRALMVEQVLWGTGATLVIASVWGVIESFGLAPHADAYWGVVIWFFCFGVARAVLMQRYR